MDEQGFEDGLLDLLLDVMGLTKEEARDMDLYNALVDVGIRNVRTFYGATVLTDNKGVVVDMEDGSQFYVTIVKRG